MSGENERREGETFKAMGVEVKFPYMGYGVQKSMMVHIIKTLMNKQNTLIESPTGTGKTLVLLCSTLAWIKESKKLARPYVSQRILEEIARQRLELLKNSRCTCGRRPNKVAEPEDDIKKEKKVKKCKIEQQQDDDEVMIMVGSPNSCEFESSKYFDSDIKQQEKSKLDKNIGTDTDDSCRAMDEENESPPVIFIDEKPAIVECIDLTADKDESKVKQQNKQPCKSCTALALESEFSNFMTDKDAFIPNQYTRIPKIYYGTRTHKQVSQVVRELNKSNYKKDLRMCILSSRERTCINDAVKNLPNRDEECRERLKKRKNKSSDDDNPGCAFKTDTLESTFERINDDFKDRGWDIEDVNEFGTNNGVCPYFGCRSLQDSADITFCPYNYLLDPRIRKSLDIKLKNSIIIFDEAHNIEDICRESSSFSLDTRQIDEILTSINVAASNYVQGSNMSDAYQFFRDKFYNLKFFLLKFDFGSQTESSNTFVARKILTQSDMLNQLNVLGLGPDSLQGVKENLQILSAKGEEQGSQDSTRLDLSEVTHIFQLKETLEFMYADGSKHIDDYRCVVTKSFIDSRNNFRRSKKDKNNTEPESTESNFVTQISLLCMSPGIAFKKIHSEAWSVIVASGTLSPIESIQTELGCAFTAPFQGGHVIPANRVLATCLSWGPNGEDLNCSFSNSLSLKFQDAVGAVVRDVCKAVPNGVLCFFPSYDRLDSLHQRWMSKGFIPEIQKSGKKIYREQKNLAPAKFEIELKNYNKNAKIKGAVLFAVYRGKVSEGIDFADSAARAVITIGIPFPNVKEVTIGLKKDYNDIARRSRPDLLPGRDWYSCQAFRALNQAVGRCIRHREDWGAIIMIDSRLRVGGQVDDKVSKWLRLRMVQHNDYRVVKDCLTSFVEARLSEDDLQKSKKIKLEEDSES